MASKPETETAQIPFKIHPRVFRALGSELVTSDVVAVIELVKNSYDAFAPRVDVCFDIDAAGKPCLDIRDTGSGMTHEMLDDVWCTVATPYRELNPESKKKNKIRRTTGAKGLGRLSAARLGHQMQLITRTESDGAWQIDVDWSGLTDASALENCYVLRTRYKGNEFQNGSGTLVRISGLCSKWKPAEIEDLGEALSRLMSPFDVISDFEIYLKPPGKSAIVTKIETSEFLKRPPYMFAGTFDSSGRLEGHYEFDPYKGKTRKQKMDLEWAIIQKDINDTLPKEERIPPKDKPGCGPFRFEIRVWDLDKESMAEAESKWAMRRTMMRGQIRAFKGISLYRDGVLVLPKSENNRDWLGLDRRRISRVGTRLATSQMVGYVSITADTNHAIDDTSDRERLARNESVEEFERVLKDIVSRLEEQRARDRETDEPKMRDLFAELSPQKLIEDTEELVTENASAGDVMPLLTEYSRKAEKARKQIERQFVYYSRLATIGTISEMLVHEVGNNCGAIDAFLSLARDWMAGKETDRKILDKRLELAGHALGALQILAEKFRPLAGRGFQRGKRTASLRETVEACLLTLGEPIKQGRIIVEEVLKGKDMLQIDPGELYPVVYNLMDNAVYWLLHRKDVERKLRIESFNARGFVACVISDTGKGIDLDDRNKIFNAGVSRRPNGSGMGLTVAGEIVEGNGGLIFAEYPGKLGGGTFQFELPPAQARSN